jgi:ribonucleoside-diphosphate reductase alpha chain
MGFFVTVSGGTGMSLSSPFSYTAPLASGSGEPLPFDWQRITAEVCQGFADCLDQQQFLADVRANISEGLSEAETWQALILAARSRMEMEPAYTFVAARSLLLTLYREVLGQEIHSGLKETAALSVNYFPTYITRGIEAGLLDERLLAFDLPTLAKALQPARDLLFTYPGLQTLADRYLLQHGKHHFELPQLLWMRVSMGLALNESNKEQSAIEFYELISQFLFTPATPTLFNAGTRHPQLSSCYLTTVEDDLAHIFKCIQDNALLSKWAGGLGNDWSGIRALGAHIQGTNGNSQGVIPFLKVANDTAVAVNQGGKRKGAVCAYLENWHLDIEDFLDLRRNTGDERRRTHDLHTACWISDEFMRRVQQG